MVVLPNTPGLERRLAYGDYVRRRSIRNLSNYQTRSLLGNILTTNPIIINQHNNIFESLPSTIGVTLFQLRKNSIVYIKEGIECSICYDDEDNIIRKLKCGHEFHLDCIDIWLSSKRSCPICRAYLN